MASKRKLYNSVILLISMLTIICVHQKLKYVSISTSFYKMLPSYLQRVKLSRQQTIEISAINGKVTTQLGSLSQSDFTDKHKSEIQILIWTPFANPNEDHWNIIFKRLNTKQCGESRCKIVYNKTSYDTADAIIFSSVYMTRYDDYEVPPTHPGNQFWVLYGDEATNFWHGRPKSMLSSLGMNWNMHFRQDSHIVSPYGSFIPIENKNDVMIHNNKDVWSTKDGAKFIAWMASNCFPDSDRGSYVEQLKKHVSVDVYGYCGNLKCGGPHGVTTGNIKMKECNDVIKKYFFYLAFENAFCKDYVTEKFYRSLSLDVIPVVMGGADYKQIAPPHSYINFMDFSSPKHLADYLVTVASDPVLYNKYFEWKSHFILDNGYPYNPFVCGLCEKLHQHRIVNNLVATPMNLTKWFDEDECHHCSWEEVLYSEPHCKLNHTGYTKPHKRQ